MIDKNAQVVMYYGEPRQQVEQKDVIWIGLGKHLPNGNYSGTITVLVNGQHFKGKYNENEEWEILSS